MKAITRPITLLMADDDEDDCELTREAFEESELINRLMTVSNGEELLDYLRHQGRFSDPMDAPRPDLILLDLNMPRMDGREALKEIKSDPELKYIPVVILTTSKAEEDIARTYATGANSFITKPVTFEGMTKTINTLSEYWFTVVELP